MDKTGLGINIPQQSILYIGLCLIGILIFIFAGILPAAGELAELDRQAAAARLRLEEQRTLEPFYQTLKKGEAKKESEILPLPQRGKLPQAQIHTLPANFGMVARKSGMSLVSANLNLKALTGDAQFLSVNVVLRGSFADFRKFLIALGELPYLERIEEIAIQEKPDAREYRLILWVAVG